MSIYKESERVIMAINSRRKGATGERELAHLLKTYGYPAERGVQYSGLKGNADVIGVDGIHIECKRAERVNDEDYMQQAERDARTGTAPVVMYRRNGERWKALLRLDVFMIIWGELSDTQKANIRDKLKLSFTKKADKIGKRAV